MDDRSVCSPQLAELDALNNTTSFPNAASVTDADKVINTKLDSSQVEGDKNEEELLKGLLTDDYCHVCEAVLLFESQRLSHYEGKKHAQKLKVHLQTKRAEKLNKESTVPQRTMPSDKDRFCELCNMVFSSHLVAKCHYEGKIHAKNLRKQGLQSPGNFLHRHTDVCTLPRPTHQAENADQMSPPEGDVEQHEAPAATITTSSTEVDLKDPHKYCPLCAASFNNPQMALQHYNGRKHQRNQAKHELIKELGDDVQQANSLMCQVCSLQFNSLEMYQAHIHGNKHHFREKKVTDLCKAQQKVYGTFADELADYIQAQKARGITPKTGQVHPQGETYMEDEEDEGKEVFDKSHVEPIKPIPNITPTSDPHQSRPSGYYPAEGWRPPSQGPAWPPHSWDYNCPPPVLPGPGSPQFTSRPMKRRRRRKQSSSSSYTTSSSYSSSYSSSDSSSMSDSDDSKYKRRERRKIRRSKKERGRRARDEDFDKEERQKKWQMRKERDDEKVLRKREESGEWEQERRRKKQKKHGKRRRKDKKTEDFKEEGGDGAMDNVKLEDGDNTKYTEVHIQAEIDVVEGEGEQDESAKPKCRKEKKKTKERVDTRTEEEKLWDDSILGC